MKFDEVEENYRSKLTKYVTDENKEVYILLVDYHPSIEQILVSIFSFFIMLLAMLDINSPSVVFFSQVEKT